MISNDSIILTKTLESLLTKSGSTISENSFFNRFCAEQVLKDSELSEDELEAGLVDGGDDGGIDGIFVIVNGNALSQDLILEHLGRDLYFELFIIQSKNTNSFKELAIQRVSHSLRDLLDLSKEIESLRIKYNPALMEAIELFRTKYLEAAILHPKLKVHFQYCSKGDTADVHKKVIFELQTLTSVIVSFFSNAEITCGLMGARELLTASRRVKSYTLQLNLTEQPMSRGGSNYVVLSSLRDYASFVTDENGALQSHLFDSNVRDYQGSVAVNKDISSTLRSDDDVDFWWLNNGITILASHASTVAKSMSLDNVLIVNGLQTTQAIYTYMSGQNADLKKNSDRSVLIRIIVTQDSNVRDRIIKATNSQTSIPQAYLRASDRIQRDIEQYFLSDGWYYDRRKNYYRNIGKPFNRIVGIPALAQAISALVYKEPHIARSRPSTLVKDDNNYNKIFKEGVSLNAFLNCVKIVRRFESLINVEIEGTTLQERYNFKLHSALVATCKHLQSTDYGFVEVSSINTNDITDDNCYESVAITVAQAREMSGRKQWSIEKIAKNSDFVSLLIASLGRLGESALE